MVCLGAVRRTTPRELASPALPGPDVAGPKINTPTCRRRRPRATRPGCVDPGSFAPGLQLLGGERAALGDGAVDVLDRARDAGFGGVLRVDLVEAQLDGEAVVPLVVVHERPVEVAAHIGAVLDGLVDPLQVLHQRAG